MQFWEAILGRGMALAFAFGQLEAFDLLAPVLVLNEMAAAQADVLMLECFDEGADGDDEEVSGRGEHKHGRLQVHWDSLGLGWGVLLGIIDHIVIFSHIYSAKEESSRTERIELRGGVSIKAISNNKRDFFYYLYLETYFLPLFLLIFSLAITCSLWSMVFGLSHHFSFIVSFIVSSYTPARFCRCC